MVKYLYHLKQAAYLLTSLSAMILTFTPSLAAVPRLSHVFAILLFWISALCLFSAYEGFTRRADLLACCASGVLTGASVCTLVALARKGALFYEATGHGERFTIQLVYFLCGRGLWLFLLLCSALSFFMAAWFILNEQVRFRQLGSWSKSLFSSQSKKALGLSGIDHTSTDCI